MLVVVLLLACNGSDDPQTPGPTGTATDTAVTEPTGATGVGSGDTAATSTLDLQVTSPPEAPGVLHLVSPSGATDWSVEVPGRDPIQADAEGIVALVGFPQGSTIDATVRQGEVVEQLQLTVPSHPLMWTVDVVDPTRSEVANGVLGVGLIGRERIEPEIFVLQGSDGDVLWWHPVDPYWDVSVATPNAERDGFVWLEINSRRESDEARMVELSLDGRRHEISPTPTAHHVGIEPVQGRYTYLSFEVWPDEPAPGGGTFDPAADRLMTAGPGGKDPQRIYSVADQLLGNAFDYPCEHSADPQDAYGYDAFVQWTHGNSLVYVPEDDSYLVYLRWIDTLLKVGHDGAQHWVLSGPYSDFTSPDGSPLWTSHDDSVLWSHGHFTDGWDGGLLMYDNGNHTNAARVVEVQYDTSTWTAEVVRSWSPPGSGFHNVLGDARKLPGGNVLVSWTVLGLMQEFTPDGDLVWEARGDPELWFNRVRFAADLDGLIDP